MSSKSPAQGVGWSLEVVRGREPGRRFALELDETVLGNAPGGAEGLDLASQESASPRRMEGRHAALVRSPQGLTVRDLESPGGTFVNRQRVLPGQARAIQPGDVIQLGGVQLKLVEVKSSPSESPARHESATTFTYEVPGGPTCRSWDDVLAASAQRWEALRGELISGRLAAFCGSIGRADLAPSPSAPGTPDERLDAWLGGLPTTRDARPELDVFPARLLFRVAPGGGTTSRIVRVANVGYRLLRSAARVEPASTTWARLADPSTTQGFVTVEQTELAVEVTIPETLPKPLSAELVIEGNGGARRVAIVLEPRAQKDPIASPADHSHGGSVLADLLARQSPTARLATWGLTALVLRLVVGVAGGTLGADAMTPSGPDQPRLGGVAVALAVLGAVAGAVLAIRRGGKTEALTGGFAGGFAGVIAAAALVATSRAVEPLLGGWASSIVAVSLLWVAIGLGLASLVNLGIQGKT